MTVAGTLFNGPGVTGSYSLAPATYAPGPVSGTITLPTTGEGLSGESPINVTVGYTGNALLDRVVTATPITLGNAAGRFMAGQSVSGTTTLSTSGADSQYTRVTVAGTLFNGPGVTASYSLAPATYAPGPVSGTITLPTTGEGLSGENPVNVTVAYTGDALLNRVVSASAVDLGRFMASQSASGTSTLSTAGDDDAFTRVTVNGTLFNSAASTSTYNLALGTYAAGAVNGSVSLPVSGEGLAGEGSYAGVVVSYSGDALQPRSVTATPISLGLAGRFMLSQSVSGSSTLSTAGADSQYTRVTVNGTLFNSATSTSTYDMAAGTYSAGAVSGSVTLPVATAENGGAGLPGEGSYAGLIVSYSGDALQPRSITATPVSLGLAGRFMANVGVSGTSTLSTAGADSQYTRVTVDGTLFNSATTTSTYNLALGTCTAGAVSGSVTLPVVTAENGGAGLPGEGSYAGLILSYSGTAVQNRVVVSTSASFGLIHLGQSISEPITLSTTGLDSQSTRVSVNNAGPDGNGLAVSGGANPLFNGPAVTDNRTLLGTPSVAGVINGTIVLSTNGEGLSGESPLPVQVSYSGQVFSGNCAVERHFEQYLLGHQYQLERCRRGRNPRRARHLGRVRRLGHAGRRMYDHPRRRQPQPGFAHLQ